MFDNVWVTTARGVFTNDPAIGTGSTSPAQDNLVVPFAGHAEAFTIEEMSTLKEAGIKARYWLSCAWEVDILGGDVITNMVDLIDQITPWPGPIYGPNAIGQYRMIVSVVNPTQGLGFRRRIAYINRLTLGGPEEL